MDEIIAFFLDSGELGRPTGIPNRLFEHLVISGLAILVATIVGLPLGLYIGHTGRGANLAINLANIGRAVPSYAILVMVLPRDPGAGTGPGLLAVARAQLRCRSSSR